MFIRFKENNISGLDFKTLTGRDMKDIFPQYEEEPEELGEESGMYTCSVCVCVSLPRTSGEEAVLIYKI